MNYYETPAISASGLKLLKKTPAHYYARYLDPNREPEEPTAAMALGSATHCAILETGEFDRRYTVAPEGLDGRSKAGKEVIAEIEASGKQRVSLKDMARINKMRDAVHAHPIVDALFKMGPVFEKEFYFDIDGTPAKMKPDLIIEPCEKLPNGLCIDLKTTTDASPCGFPKQVANLDMHIQAAFYSDNLHREWKTKHAPEFWWICVENKEPHLTTIYKCPQSLIDLGKRDVSELLDVYRDCMKTGNWYGYSQEVEELEPVSWQNVDNLTEE